MRARCGNEVSRRRRLPKPAPRSDGGSDLIRGALTVLLAVVAARGCAGAPKPAQSTWAAANPAWVDPVEPFLIEENVYYVGTRGLASFLIATREGHFLLDGGLPENAEIIARNIEALGFKLRDVKFLLNSHAHVDHSGGLSSLKKITGAALVATEQDRSALEGGFYLGSEEDDTLRAPPVMVDRTIADGEALVLGEIALTARLTPGHTPGCTSWTMTAGGRDILFFCSATVAANRLVDPPQYQGIVDDYRETFRKTRDWRPDILLANHPEFFQMEDRRARQVGGDEAAFVDADAFPLLMRKFEADFEAALARKTAEAASNR
jgi:metallo-beta-lactamase class B